ncbi:MAG: periplasmic heavy metal sensor [Rhodobacteraceae bacterium]|nr:periplasmic heavy metal sensor [Paracoccaceae bacterium]
MADDLNKQPGRRNWTRIALIVSLALNLGVAGMIGGAMLRDGPERHGRADRDISALGLRLYYRALGDDQQEALKADLANRRGSFRAGRETLKAHMSDLAAALTADPYDAGAVATVLQAQGVRVSDNIALGHKLLLDRFAAMAPEDRAAMAERLVAGPRHHR